MYITTYYCVGDIIFFICEQINSFRLTFSRIISIFAILIAFPVFVRQTDWKKNSHDSDDSLPINCLSSANQQCVQPVSMTVFFKFSKLSVNPSWVKWCIFKTPQRSHSLERAQEVKIFPQSSGERQKSVMTMSSDICNFCTCATGCQKFSDIR